ncbi:MAG: hypothetical protein U1D55_07400 [Phycisphaerae bacterium]
MSKQDNQVSLAPNLLEGLKRGAFQGHFGGCPACGASDGPHHVYRLHWFVCETHRCRWQAGENLFREWRFQTAADWERTHRRLQQFRVVKPVYPIELIEAGEAGYRER